MNDLASVIGKNIASLRKAKGLTQSDLAHEIHYSDKSISKWELGYAAPSVDILIDIAHYFGVTVDYLINEQDEESIQAVTSDASEKEEARKDLINKGLILAMSMAFVFFVAVCIYFSPLVFRQGENPVPNLIVFLWMIPAAMVIASYEVFRFYHNRIAVIALLSVFVWSLLICFCVQFGFVNEGGSAQQVWFILGVGAPLQVILILLANYKRK